MGFKPLLHKFFGPPKGEASDKDDVRSEVKPDEGITEVIDTILAKIDEGADKGGAEPEDLLQPVLSGGELPEEERGPDMNLLSDGEAGNGGGEASDGISQPAELEGESSPEGESSNTAEGDTAKQDGAGAGKNELADLFEQEESEDDTPRSLLIASMPEASLQEIFNEAEEVKALIRWREDQMPKVRPRKPRRRHE